jgi:hypothetical protein
MRQFKYLPTAFINNKETGLEPKRRACGSVEGDQATTEGLQVVKEGGNS